MYRLLSLLLLLSITTCSQPHAHIDHILILRVCLPRVGKDFNAEACSAMLTLFENTMLISLRGQNVDFCVLAYVPHQVCGGVGCARCVQACNHNPRHTDTIRVACTLGILPGTLCLLRGACDIIF